MGVCMIIILRLFCNHLCQNGFPSIDVVNCSIGMGMDNRLRALKLFQSIGSLSCFTIIFHLAVNSPNNVY